MTKATIRLALHASLSAAVLLGAAPALRAEPETFDSPGSAVAVLIAALEAADRDALVAVFGPENEDVILTGDDADDRADWGDFLAAQRELSRIVVDGDTAILEVGRDLWPLPIPIVLDGAVWRFDAAAGREEMILRRIGENEVDVIDLLRGYVAAQADYRTSDPDGDGLLTFAAGVISSPGTRDGLYWPAEEGAPESPIGDFMARAAADGYSLDGVDEAPDPYLGYYYRVLQEQGPDAPGGAMSYLVNGHMVAGHALLAFPSAYGDTGIMSFMVGEYGVVYEADLGEDTLSVAAAIEAFDPGDGWAAVEGD